HEHRLPLSTCCGGRKFERFESPQPSKSVTDAPLSAQERRWDNGAVAGRASLLPPGNSTAAWHQPRQAGKDRIPTPDIRSSADVGGSLGDLERVVRLQPGRRGLARRTPRPGRPIRYSPPRASVAHLPLMVLSRSEAPC